MLPLTSLIDIVRRLTAALRLVKLAEEVIPELVLKQRTSAESASVILGQLPALRAEIDAQIKSALHAMETVQDRIEVLGQFLLLHRSSLTPQQSNDLDADLRALRG